MQRPWGKNTLVFSGSNKYGYKRWAERKGGKEKGRKEGQDQIM